VDFCDEGDDKEDESISEETYDNARADGDLGAEFYGEEEEDSCWPNVGDRDGECKRKIRVDIVKVVVCGDESVPGKENTYSEYKKDNPC